MNGEDFNKSFVNAVNNSVSQDKKVQAQNGGGNKFIVTLVIAILELVVIVALVIVIITLEQKRENGDGVPLSGDPEPAVGTAVEKDDDGKVISMRAGCEAENMRYDFFKDNHYEIADADGIEISETGTYTIKGDTVKFEPEDGNAREGTYKSKKLTDNGVEIECTEYDDV